MTPRRPTVEHRLRVSKPTQERHELVKAPVDVADDVERPVIAATIRVERLANDRDRVDGFDALENVDDAIPLAPEILERLPLQVIIMVFDPRSVGAVGTRAISFEADRGREIENDRDGQRGDISAPKRCRARLVLLGPEIRCVDDGRGRRPLQAFGRDRIENLERLRGDALVALVVADERAAAGPTRRSPSRENAVRRTSTLPEPEAPIKTTRAKSGIVSRTERPPSAWERRTWREGRRSIRAPPHSRGGRPPHPPTARTPLASISKR